MADVKPLRAVYDGGNATGLAEFQSGETLGIVDGGTGRNTGTTAYALVATGTTATGAQQTLANGATTEILVGGGASALPAWTTATGLGAPVRATSPTLVTPALGTPASGVLTNCTGTAAGLTAGNVTTNANLTGHVTSVGNATTLGSFTIAQLNTAISDADAATTGANTFTGAQVLSDQQVSRAMMIDCGYTFVDKGNSGTTTQTIDYTAGSHQKITCTGAHTIATSNWPPTGNLGEILLELVNGAAYTITWPTINWIKFDGTTTTTFASNGVTLQSSGTDFCLLWTRDAGTTIYGKWVR